jgi:shikimate dehydrogenase
MMYSRETTPFNQWALDHGAKAAFDGFGMLVEQAAESFRLWRGVMPATQMVIKELKA